MRALFIIAWLYFGIAPVHAQAPERLHERQQSIAHLRDAEIRVTEGAISRNQTIISVPYAYKRTGVLRSDIRGLFKQAHGVAGSPVYFAGVFQGTDVWCVFPLKSGGGIVTPWCASYIGDRAFQGNPLNPRLFFSISYQPAGTSYPQFDIEERVVEVEPDLRFDYRFIEWDETDADVNVDSAGELAYRLSVPRAADGSATFDTLAGQIRLEPGADRKSAKVVFTPSNK